MAGKCSSLIDLMGFSCDFHGIFGHFKLEHGILGDFPGIYWDFNGITMGCSVFMGLSWNLVGFYAIFLKFHEMFMFIVVLNRISATGF